MPSRDENGRRLSGSEQRKAAGALPPLRPAARRAFAALGPAPERPEEQLTWARRVVATSTFLLMTGQLDAQRARAIKDNVVALGMTHNRAALEETVDRLKTQLNARSQGLAIIVKSGAELGRSPNSRGQRRGPRLLPDEPPEPPPGPRPIDDEDKR